MGLGVTNQRGEELRDLAYKHNLKIENTFLKKKPNRKWTWMHPGQNTKNEIDHILTNDLEIIKDVSVLPNFEFPSDHRAGRCKVEILKRSKFKNFKKLERWRKKIIPVKNWGEAKKELKEGLHGNESLLEKYRTVEKGIVKIKEKFGVTREKLKVDKLSKDF